MASGRGTEDALLDKGGIPLDIDDVHMLLQVEQEQIQRRTFTNWINAQLSKRSPPSSVSDLFCDLRDGARLLDLLEVMSGQRMKREKGHGLFQQRGDIETALNFLRKKSVKLVNINIPDLIDGRPSIILGLVWTIILHCHIEELASTLSFSSRHSSLDSLASVDSGSGSPALGSPIPGSPIPRGVTSPLHARFRLSAKKALLLWVRDQCQRVGCSLSVKDFKSSWRSGEAFLAILCSLRADPVADLSLARSRSNQENLEEAFCLAERELHIPRLLEPQDVDVKEPDEKSIMTYVAQFLQYSNDMPSPDEHLQLNMLPQASCLSPVNLPAHYSPALAVSPLYQASPNQRAREVTSWLQQAYEELSEGWVATERASYEERYQAFQGFAGSLGDQRRSVVTLLGAMRRCAEPSPEQQALRLALERLEAKLQQYKAELDISLPSPLDCVVVWLQRVEAVLTEEGGGAKDHAHAAKDARAKQETLKTLIEEMSRQLNALHTFRNVDDSGTIVVPMEKLEEIKRRFTNVRVTAKYHGIKLDYQEDRHVVLDLLGRIAAKLRSWKGPHSSQEAVLLLLQDWHETVERQGLLLILMDALQKLKQTANTYTSKAALAEDSQLVGRQVKEAESEAALNTEAVWAVKGIMGRVLSAWEAYHKGLLSLQAFLDREAQSQSRSVEERPQLVMAEWSACQAQLNEAGNLLIDVAEPSASSALAKQLCHINKQWADHVKRTTFEVPPAPSVGPPSAQTVQALVQETGCLLREPIHLASGPLKTYRKKLQLLSKKIVEVDRSCLCPSPVYQTGNTEKLQQALPEAWQLLAKAERRCGDLQRAVSMLEGHLAELAHWGTEALEAYPHLKERERSGHYPGLETRVKVLVSRGLQLESQVVAEGQDLQAQKTCPLQHVSSEAMQDRVSEAVSQCQETVEMLSSLGSRRDVGETLAYQPSPKVVIKSHLQPGPVEELFAMVASKDMDQARGQTRHPTQPPPRSPSQTLQQRHKRPQEPPKNYGHAQDVNQQISTTIKRIPYAENQIQSQPLVRPTRRPGQSSPATTRGEAKCEPVRPCQTFAKSHAEDQSPKEQRRPILNQAPVGPAPQPLGKAQSPSLSKAQSPSLSKAGIKTIRDRKESLYPTQTPTLTQISPRQSPKRAHTPKFRVREQPNTPPGEILTPLQPPVMVSGEVHSRAQSMAKSRLEKTRFRLQEHVQEAIVLFSDREISESQAKRKERALRTLRPAVLEEFLGAVEGFGAFCSGAQLHDLLLLSDSVRTQWEDVLSEMSAFVPVLWCKLRGGAEHAAAVACEEHTNTGPDSVQIQQACLSTEAGAVERVEALQGLCETLTPERSPCPPTAQLRESAGRQETKRLQLSSETCGTVPLQDSRGEQFRGPTPQRAAGMQTGSRPKRTVPQMPILHCPQHDLSPLGNTCPPDAPDRPPDVRLLQLQVRGHPPNDEAYHGPPHVQGHHRLSGKDPGQDHEALLHAEDHSLKVHIQMSRQQRGLVLHPQAIVRGDSVKSRQTAEWTVVVPQAATAPPQEEGSSQQEVVERFRESCLAFESQLQRNQRCLEADVLPEPLSVAALRTQLKHLQALKQETEVLWFEFELQSSQLSRVPLPAKGEDGRGGVERTCGRLIQQWRGQQIYLQNRMASLDKMGDLMESAECQIALITEQLDQIIRQPVAISSLAVADPRTASDLKEMDHKLLSELSKVSARGGAEEESEGLLPHHALCGCSHRLHQLRQRLKKAESAAQALDRFLAGLRETEAGMTTTMTTVPSASRESGGRRRDEASWKRERCSWRDAIQQRVRGAGEEAGSVDGLLKAAGMTLSMGGATVTCLAAVASLARRLEEMDKEKTESGRGQHKGEELQLRGREQLAEREGLSHMGRSQRKTEDDLLCTGRGQAREEVRHAQRGTELQSGEAEPKKRRQDEQNKEDKVQTERGKDGEKEEEEQRGLGRRGEGEGPLEPKGQRRGGPGMKEGEEKRRFSLLRLLRELQGAAEQQRLKEPSLPAVQQRMRALAELEGRLAGQRSELRYLCDGSPRAAGPDGVTHTEKLESLWEETHRAITDRLDQCGVLMELLKRFKNVRGELSATLQRAERTISEQASYLGKDNLHKLHTKVASSKAELSGVGDQVEEVRGISRQLQAHLRQIPDCVHVPFESEADSLMDGWLDVTERTDSHLENLRVGLSLWEGLLLLGGEVESWSTNKLAAFAQAPPFQTEDEVNTMQEEMRAQEENMERFHRRAAEIQLLLHSEEPPLELQVVESQTRKRMEEVKELFSEAQDVYRQLELAKGQVAARMTECHDSLQTLYHSLATLSASDPPTLLAHIQGLCGELQSQGEQAERLMEELELMACVVSPQSLQSLGEDGLRLQETLADTRQLLSQREEQAEGDSQALSRLQGESEQLEKWLQAAEVKAEKEREFSHLREEVSQQSERTEILGRLVASLQGGPLKRSSSVTEGSKLLERYRNLQMKMVLCSEENQSSLTGDTEGFRTLSEATRSWVRELQQQLDSPVEDEQGTLSPAEQKLHSAQAVLCVMSEGESRLEQLRVAGRGLTHNLRVGDELRGDVQDTIQKAEQQWTRLLQSVHQHCSVLQAEPELTASFLAQRLEVRSRMAELQHRTAELPSLFFPWPGTEERRQASHQARDLLGEAESLGLALSALADHKRELARRTNDPIWHDSSWDTLEARQSSLLAQLKGVCAGLEEGVCAVERCGQLLHNCLRILTSLQGTLSASEAQQEGSAGLSSDDAAPLEALLQEARDTERDCLHLLSLKDSLSPTLTADGEGSLSQQVSTLLSQRGALETHIRERLAHVEERRVQRVREEAACLQTALEDLAERSGRLSENCGALTDVDRLEQRWRAIQACDTSLMELAARVSDLQNAHGSKVTQERLPADVILAVGATAKELESLRSGLAGRKRQAVDTTANGVREAIAQLQRWSQAAPSQCTQATLDEGLQFEGALRGALSRRDFLLDCLGKKRTKKLEKSAADALSKSTALLETLSISSETLSISSTSQGGTELELDKKKSWAKNENESLTRKTLHLTEPEEMTAVASIRSPHTENPERDENKKKRQSRSKSTAEETHAPKEPAKKAMRKSAMKAGATEHNQDCVSRNLRQAETRVTSTEGSPGQTSEGDDLVQTRPPGTTIPGIFTPKTHNEDLSTCTDRASYHEEPREVTSTPSKIVTIVLEALDPHLYGVDAHQVRPEDLSGTTNVHSDLTHLNNARSLATKSHPAFEEVECTAAESNAQSFPSHPLPTSDNGFQTERETSEPLRQIATIVLDAEFPAVGAEKQRQDVESSRFDVTSHLEGPEICSGVKPVLTEQSDCLPAPKDVCAESDLATQLKEISQCEPSSHEPQTSELATVAQNQEKPSETDSSVTSKKVFTVVLEMPSSPPVQEIERRESLGSSAPDAFGSQDVSSPETKHHQHAQVETSARLSENNGVLHIQSDNRERVDTNTSGAESNGTADFRTVESHSLESKEPQFTGSTSESPSVWLSTESKEVKSTSSESQSEKADTQNSKRPESTDGDELKVPKSNGRVADSEPVVSGVSETAQARILPSVTDKQPDIFQTDKNQAGDSVTRTSGNRTQAPEGDASAQTRLPGADGTDGTDIQQMMASTDSTQSDDTADAEHAVRGHVSPSPGHLRDNAVVMAERDESERSETSRVSKETEMLIGTETGEGTQGQVPEGRETEERTLDLSPSDVVGVMEAAGGSRVSPQQRESAPQQRESAPQQRESAPQQRESAPQQRESAPQQRESAPQQRESALQSILSEIQGLVEKSDITNREQHMDSAWYLEASPREAEIGLVRTVLRVLGCRYRPAQLNVTAMANQLEEAEDYRHCVLEQVAGVSAATVCDPDIQKAVEGRWSAALLDASATVQVKAAQLDHVTSYHKQTQAIRTLLEDLAAETEKLSLDALGSSAHQAESLHVLLLTMEQKKGMMGELLQLSSQLSAHLSEAEGSGALLAQNGDLREEWRLLEGAVKRSLRHASISSSQCSLLLREAELLQAKLEDLQKSTMLLQSSQTVPDIRSTLDVACLATDLQICNQMYLHLQSKAEAHGLFSLSCKEKEETERVLQGLRSLLEVTKSHFDTYSPSIGNISSAPQAKISKCLKDLFIWIKQAQNHITVGRKLALFPEEARTQIAQMKKLQSDILSRRSKMKVEVEEIKAMASDMDKMESDQVLTSLNTIEELYKTTADSSAHALEIMEVDLAEREKLLSQLAGMDTWLAEAHIKRDPFTHVENASKADIPELERRLRFHQLATEEVESQLALVVILTENSQETAAGLSPAESRYLVNRLSGLWTELDGMVAHEQATSWELEELIHEWTSSDKELATVQASLKQMSADLEPQTFPTTKDTLSATELLKHMLMEHQCHIQELQHCQEAERSSLLCIIGELQEKAKAVSIHGLEHEKYLNLQKQMEDSRDIARERIERSKDKSLRVGERFRLCQTLLVELPLVKTQCQEAADQLEAIAQDLDPSQLTSGRERIRRTVRTLVSWEHTVTDNNKSLERKLHEVLRFRLELPALMKFLHRSRQELELAEPMEPDEKAIDIKLRRCWVIWRCLESGVRVLEALRKKEKMDLRTCGELYTLRDATMNECHSCMESLSQAREALKDYHWAAQGAIAFLRNAETTFLLPPGGFLDCSEEQSHTQHALTSLQDGLQAHISHLVELVPQQACLSRPKTEQLHIGILSHLLVGRAILEAQAQLRLEALQRCVARQPGHRKCHDDIRKLLSRSEARLSQCAAQEVTSYDKCVDQQNRAKALMQELRGLAGKLEELRAGCSVQGCGVGNEGELGALWRYWACLRRGGGLLLAQSNQRAEEWRDINTSMEQCYNSLASLQAKLPDSSAITSTQGGPQELLAQAQLHQAGLEQEQRALASLELRLTHLLGLSGPQDAGGPAAPVGRRFQKIQEGFRSLKEQSTQVLKAAVSEEAHRQQVQEEIEEAERRVLALLSTLESCTNRHQQQEVREDLSSQRARLQSIVDGVRSRYAAAPVDIDRRIRDVQHSLQKAEEKVLQSVERNSPLNKLTSRVMEVQTGLEQVRRLLEQRSPTITEAQNTLKCVWDELDSWHGRLALLEVEAQDLVEDQPEHAHLLMDRLTQPLQLYQDTAQMAEQRTAFLGKLPACLHEYEDMLHSATCWIEEAQSWLSAPCTYTTARSLHGHANSLQLVLDDSDRIRATLGSFGPLLEDISTVCDTAALEERLAGMDRQVHTMQQNIIGPLERLLHAAAEVEAIEVEVKTMEKNITKIRTILSTMDTADIPQEEHLHNRQVIMANLQAMQRTVEEMESCRGELGLPQGAEENLVFYTRAGLLLQPLQELELLTQTQAATLENKVSEEEESTADVCITTSEPSERLGDTERLDETLQGHYFKEDFEACRSEEEEEEEEDEERPPSSSSDTLTCSVPEDPDDEPLGGQERVETDAPTSEIHEDSEDVPEAHTLPEDEALDSPFWSDMDSRPVPMKSGSAATQPGSEHVETEAVTKESTGLAPGEVIDESSPVTMTTVTKESTGLAPGEVIDEYSPVTMTTVTKESTGLAPGEVIDESSPVTMTTVTKESTGLAPGEVIDESSPVTMTTVTKESTGLAPGDVIDESSPVTMTTEPVAKVAASAEDHQCTVAPDTHGTQDGTLFTHTPGHLLVDTHTSNTHSQQAVAEETHFIRAGPTTPFKPPSPSVAACLDDSDEPLSEATDPQHDLAEQEQVESLVCVVEEFDLGQSDQFTNLYNHVPNIEYVFASPLRKSPEETAQLQQVSAALLQGLAGLVELTEEQCGTANQAGKLHNHSQLQALLARHKRVFQALGSQVAFIQHLFQREPLGALQSQEEERVQLESRVTALQQRALEQGVVAQRRLQEWIQWEADCVRLGRLLDELEALMPSREPEDEGDEEELCPKGQIQDRLDACQRVLAGLGQSRAALGCLLDRGRTLQSAVGCSPSVNQTGGALELRWRSVRRRAEQEVQRCRDIRDSWASFQKDSVSLSEWLVGSHKQLEAWSGLAHTSPLDQDQARSHLTQLMDLAQKVSSARAGARLLQLREADCPGLRRRLAQLELSWSQLTSGLPKAQEGLLQQLLQSGWPPLGVLGDMERWVSELGARLCEEERERDKVLQAPDAAQFSHSLQRYQELKAAVASGQLTLDFLCQSGPQVAGADSHALHSECTLFAERLGALNARWLEFQGDLGSQIRMTEQMHHVCADRERRLRRLHSWVSRQTDWLEECCHPVSQTLAHKALLEWEAADERVKEVREELQELRATRVRVGKEEEEEEEEHPSDDAFIQQTDDISRACATLSQQMEGLRPALQQVLEEWRCFERALSEAALHTTRVRCALQHQPAPLLSPQQATDYVERLEQFQEKAGKWEELWGAVDQSYQRLRSAVNHGAAQLLTEQMEGERTRWKEACQEVKEELQRSREVLSLWQEYTGLSDHCSRRQRHLQRQWEALLSSLRTPQHDIQADINSAKKLQDGVNDLQSSMGDVLVASKPLIGRLEPLAASFIQSETRLLSRDVLLLSQALAGKTVHLQEDLEQQERFCTSLETLEKQTQSTLDRLTTSVNDRDSVKKIVVDLSDLLPSLVDLSEMSRCASPDDPEAERLSALIRLWVEGLTRGSDTCREMQAEVQRSQNFEEKCDSLMDIQKNIEEDLVAQPAGGGYSDLRDMLLIHQRHHVDLVAGHQLLQGLTCDAVGFLEPGTSEQKRSELMAKVCGVRDRWRSTVALAGQRRALVKGLLGRWRLYSRNLRFLRRLLRDMDPLLPPAGLAVCSLQQLRSSVENYQRVEETIGCHAVTFSQTLEAGGQLCASMTESPSRGQMRRELQELQETWESTTSLLAKRRTQVNTVLQRWEQCQGMLSDIARRLDGMRSSLKQPLPERLERPEDEQKVIQEMEVSLERAAGGLWELTTARTDLSQYVAAGDTSLLEERLEALHCQWEELCTKVSLRRQEIADRLNAWTIFNDKNKELCDWLTQMENKVSHSGDLSIEEMVEKLKKDCMEEINLFSENKSHLKQLGEQLLLASDQAKQTQLHGSLREVNQRWHDLFLRIEARVRKLKETLVAMQQLDKNMSNLRCWLARMEAALWRPVTYSVCHHQEIQRRLGEQQELQRDIEQHTAGVASVLSLCDVLLCDEDAAESDSLQETSRSLDQRWRAICTMALDRRLRIEETWRLWSKFLDDYSRFEDWLKMAERTAANPNSANVLYTAAKEELKKFEGFQRQVHERLTQLELVNHQYRRLARENRTDRASQLRAMVHEGNRRWDTLHRRTAAILRRLKHFTSQREEFEGTRESMLVWLTELDLQLTNVEHFSESDVHHKMQQINSFQREISLNTERIDGLIVFGEVLIQRSSPLDAALIEEELEELHSYCQEVFSRLVRFHQLLSQPPTATEEPELSTNSSTSLESSLELVGRPWLGRSQGSLPATPTRLLASPLERSGRETPVSVDSLPLEWDHTGDVGGSSSHEDGEEEEEEEEAMFFSALSEMEVEVTETQEEFFTAMEGLAPGASSSAPSRSMAMPESPKWVPPESEPLSLDSEHQPEPSPTHTSTPLKQAYVRLMSECSGSVESFKRVSLILDDEEQPEALGLTGLTTVDKQSGVIERWELLQAQSRRDQQAGPRDPQQLTSDLCDITSWLGRVTPELGRLQQSDPAASIQDMEEKAKQLKEMQKAFARYKSVMLSVNLDARQLQGCGRSPEAQELQEGLGNMNQGWSQACTGLEEWESSLRKTLMRCQEFHETLHSLLLWLAHAESRRYAVDIQHPDTPPSALYQHRSTLGGLEEELRNRKSQLASLQTLWSQLQPEEEEEEEEEGTEEEGTEDSGEAKEKLHVTGSKLRLLQRQVAQDLSALQQRLDCEGASLSSAEGEEGAGGVPSSDTSQDDPPSQKGSNSKRVERREPSPPPPRSFFHRVLRAAFPLHLLLLLLLILLTCLVPLPESEPGCTTANNNFARSFHPMLRYTNGPPPT